MIQRLWIGQEVEGALTQEMTLFIESELIEESDIPVLHNVCQKHDLKRLYFGANEKDVQFNVQDVKRGKKHLKIVVECSSQDNIASYLGLCDKIVYRLPLWISDSSKITFKTRNENECRLYEKFTTNSLCGVINGVYPQDKLIKL